MGYTPQELREACLGRVDLDETDYIETKELDKLIEDSFVELHDLLVTTFGDDFDTRVAQFSTVVTGDDSDRVYALPTDFWRLVRVGLVLDDGSEIPLERFNRSAGTIPGRAYSWGRNAKPKYSLDLKDASNSQSFIIFNCKPASVVTINLHYVPRAPKLADGVDGTQVETAQTATGDSTLAIPADVDSLDYEGWGAAGGGGGNDGAVLGGNGGAGAYISGTLPVTPGETLTTRVGAGGNPGGGSTSTSGSDGGGEGGGYSGIFRGTQLQANALAVAAGGGGAGGAAVAVGEDGGAGGALTGVPGNGVGPGQGGTQLAGGAGGAGTPGVDGSPGVSLSGGAGGVAGGTGGAGTGGDSTGGDGGQASDTAAGGGGGGGGYFGGGGGEAGNNAQGSGGAGGSSYGPANGFMDQGTGVTPPKTTSDTYLRFGVANSVGVGGAAETAGGRGLLVFRYITGRTELPLFGHDEYVILDVGIKLRAKEEGDTSTMAAQKAAYEDRIKRQAQPKDRGQPEYLADMRSVEEHEDFQGAPEFWDT